LLISRVWGNAEKIIVDSLSQFPSNKSYIPTNLHILKLPYESIVTKLQVQPILDSKSKAIYIQIDNAKESFEIRACWSAVNPLDIYIKICEECTFNTVIVEAIYNGVPTKRYKKSDSIMISLGTLYLTLVIEKLYFGVPMNTIQTIGIILVVLVITLIAIQKMQLLKFDLFIQ
jgi:hypothetical protein